MTRPFVEIADGHQLFIRDWGTGPTVLLLASWAMDSRLWASTMLALNNGGVRTVAYDRRGHGKSTDPGVVSYDLLAEDLNSVISALDLRDVTIVAHSAAGGEAIRYLTRHGSERISRLFMVGATGPRTLSGPDNPLGLPEELFQDLLFQLSFQLDEWIEANARPFAPQARDRTIDWLSTMVLNTSRRILVDFQREAVETDLSEEARALNVPVTIIHGTLDASAPLNLTARRYAEIVPDAEVLIYNDVAHGVMVDARERLVTDILDRIL